MNKTEIAWWDVYKIGQWHPESVWGTYEAAVDVARARSKKFGEVRCVRRSRPPSTQTSASAPASLQLAIRAICEASHRKRPCLDCLLEARAYINGAILEVEGKVMRL